MSLSFDPMDGEELDLDDLFSDVQDVPPNLYISDSDKAVELLSKLIRDGPKSSARAIKEIRSGIDRMFTLFENANLESGLEFYERFLDLCAQLSARQKIRIIQDKTVIGFGGAFSAGKSKFINSISGIDDILPVAQAPTTSIPTYIIKSTRDVLRANSRSGYSEQLSKDAMNALTHEFYNVYDIGFSAFVESIIVESTRFSLPDGVALLDTPGYTKYDDKNDAKLTITDKQKAFEQLRASDFLIWLANIEGGGLTNEDMLFLKSLRVKTPILIVFTHADTMTEEKINMVLDGAKKTIAGTSIKCFGITAYSSKQNKEYGASLIPSFINYTLDAKVRGNDIVGEFDRTAEELHNRLESAIQQSRNTARALFRYLTKSKQFLDIRSLVELWGQANQEGYRLNTILNEYESITSDTRRKIHEYIRQRD